MGIYPVGILTPTVKSLDTVGPHKYLEIYTSTTTTGTAPSLVCQHTEMRNMSVTGQLLGLCNICQMCHGQNWEKLPTWGDAHQSMDIYIP